MFNSDSTHFCVDPCVSGGLISFKSNFIEGSHTEAPERSSDNTTCKAIMIGESVAACTLNDNGELCTLKPHMAYAPSSKFCLIFAQ